MIMLNPQFSSGAEAPKVSQREMIEGELKKVQSKLESARASLGEASLSESPEAGDWMHTVMELEKEEEELVRALEDTPLA